MLVKSGNSLRNKSKATPSEAIIGLYPLSVSSLMIGIHLVACPNPQFRGAISMFFFCFQIIVKFIKTDKC